MDTYFNEEDMMKDWLIDWKDEHRDDPEFIDMADDEFFQAAEDAWNDRTASQIDAVMDRGR